MLRKFMDDQLNVVLKFINNGGTFNRVYHCLGKSKKAKRVLQQKHNKEERIIMIRGMDRNVSDFGLFLLLVFGKLTTLCRDFYRIKVYSALKLKKDMN